MKKTAKLVGIIALAAIIGFSIAACKGGGGEEDKAPKTITYSGRYTPQQQPVEPPEPPYQEPQPAPQPAPQQVQYTLKITENQSRAARFGADSAAPTPYKAKAGDSYELTAVTGAITQKSTGTVTSYSGNTITLKPEGSETTFTAKVMERNIGNSVLQGFTGSVTWDGDSTPTTLPTQLVD